MIALFHLVVGMQPIGLQMQNDRLLLRFAAHLNRKGFGVAVVSAQAVQGYLAGELQPGCEIRVQLKWRPCDSLRRPQAAAVQRANTAS